jgi:apolipoprotein N-acyltransferase
MTSTQKWILGAIVVLLLAAGAALLLYPDRPAEGIVAGSASMALLAEAARRREKALQEVEVRKAAVEITRRRVEDSRKREEQARQEELDLLREMSDQEKVDAGNDLFG